MFLDLCLEIKIQAIIKLGYFVPTNGDHFIARVFFCDSPPPTLTCNTDTPYNLNNIIFASLQFIILGNPSSIGPAPSPQASHTNAEEQAYLDKLKQLRKYIEPLKRMVAKIEKEEGLCQEQNISIIMNT